MERILKLENVRKVYMEQEVATTAIMGISLEIQKGEFVAIMGPSGCGKSSLLNMLGLLDRPTSGNVFFMEKNTNRLSERELTLLRRKHIGFVFQNFNLIDELTVYENIELPLLYRQIKPQERKSRVLAIMEELAIAHKQNVFPRQLSGGQQQRVAVCRALVGEPELILADEPTGNLDSLQGQEVMNLLARLNERGITIVMVTHSQAYAGYCRRILNLFDGHLVTDLLI